MIAAAWCPTRRSVFSRTSKSLNGSVTTSDRRQAGNPELVGTGMGLRRLP
jgi:hypothetical protein